MNAFPRLFCRRLWCLCVMLCAATAPAIELGLRTAIAQINGAGGVLGGRPIALVTKDNRSILAQVQTLNEAKLPNLVPRAEADSIIDSGVRSSYLFRLSLRDKLASAEMYMRSIKHRKIIDVTWFNPRDTTVIKQYGRLTGASAQAVVHRHRGVIKLYKPPFAPARHEAPGSAALRMARYSREGVLVPAQK